ncbi:hypothetical protein TNIN_254131 [Trichonephila inaurata madagascariensis]|uniref:Uncharacterized protein n=1 Tax=Trichonephila inaurata madagascariensis TaxID=2747483 RepID=A0A8X6XL25_9ARAC|nr:hypothetical protein TNIN_254131 [Trichonephila inaurata madagascariensis]
MEVFRLWLTLEVITKRNEQSRLRFSVKGCYGALKSRCLKNCSPEKKEEPSFPGNWVEKHRGGVSAVPAKIWKKPSTRANIRLFVKNFK